MGWGLTSQRVVYIKGMLPDLVLDKTWEKALDLLENSGSHIFLTGRAGTGKSTLLNHWRSVTKKQIAVLAPTGVAAVNVKGQTVHSFCRFRPDITVDQVKKLRLKPEENIYKKLDAIVIDEISMTRADILDCVDKFLRINRDKRRLPFGGAQMIFIGDLYQLPPVVTREEKAHFSDYYQSPYFFDAKVFEKMQLELIELTHMFRQTDAEFIGLLEAIRTNQASPNDMNLLNARHSNGIHRGLVTPQDNEVGGSSIPGGFTITLTSTNQQAEEINTLRLEELKGKTWRFPGYTTGEFDNKSLPTLPVLELKTGAQVMLLNNDAEGRWVNGSVGKITKILRRSGLAEVVKVKLSEGETVDVLPHTWELFKMRVETGSGGLASEVVGTFNQYPIKLAWAVTIHKSQGKTFDQVIIDVGRGTFAHGQLYVALSRCRSLEGITLKQPLEPRHILLDPRVAMFHDRFRYQQAQAKLPEMEKIARLQQAIATGAGLEIEYLRGAGEWVKRHIKPLKVGDIKHSGKTFLGLEAEDLSTDKPCLLRLDRIVNILEET